ncbi:MAG: hypothetical protein K1X83_07980 [Oligoflexia bacterium]|nr:hypothetical protein [Oligoflexia bacterium]
MDDATQMGVNGTNTPKILQLGKWGVSAEQFKVAGSALNEFLAAEYMILAPHLVRESSQLVRTVLLAAAAAGLMFLGALALLVTFVLLGVTIWPEVPMIIVFAVAAFVLFAAAFFMRIWANRRLMLQEGRIIQLWRTLRVNRQ